ncbi:right-handed parallel beta-helix repeat-containing protein [candidate division KSB1 bacterium]|nr:right-handed parallel beta-helix repeat-containing protein [candidate division KSB1 bacterium]
MNRVMNICLSIALISGLAWGQNILQVSSVTSAATFNSIEISAGIAGDDNQNATIEIYYCTLQQGWRQGHDLIRIKKNMFSGSLFFLYPDTEYFIKLKLIDPDGVTGSSEMQLTQSTRNDVFEAVGKRNVYVAPNGNDANDGSQGSPFASIQHAANQAEPGDIIHIMPGVYHQSVDILKKGRPDAPIVFKGEGAAILDGSDLTFNQVDAIDNWQAINTSGVYQAHCEYEPGQVHVDGQLLYRYNRQNELASCYIGPPGGWYFHDKTLYLALTDGGDPDAYPIQVSCMEYGMLLDGADWVMIDGLEIRYYGLSTYGKGIYLKNSSNCVFQNNKIHSTWAALWLKGKNSNDNVIRNNEIWETSIYNWPWDYLKGSYFEGAGIMLEAGSGTIIAHNEIYGYFNAVLAAQWDDMNDDSWNCNVDVSNNLMHHIKDDCVEPEGACRNFRIYKNTMYETLVGISLAPITVGPTYAIRNTIHKFHLTSFKFSSNTSGRSLVYHNTALTDVPETNGMVSSGEWSNIIFRNNIIAGVVYAFEDYEINGPADFDYDNFYTTDPNRFIKWAGTRYYSPTEFYSATGQEEHAISTESMFVDAQGGNFHLTAESPNVDRALRIPNINDNYQGNAPDIGAFEYFPVIPNSVLKYVDSKPSRFVLHNIYPNPFNSQAAISYSLREPETIDIRIYDALGRTLLTLHDGDQQPGDYSIHWQAHELPSGIYWVKMKAGEQVETKQAVLVK